MKYYPRTFENVKISFLFVSLILLVISGVTRALSQGGKLS